MFKVSQDIYLNASDSANHSKVFGKYQHAPDDDSYKLNEHSIFVSPELTEIEKIVLLHFPEDAVNINSNVEFFVKRNGVRGNFEVKVETPLGNITKTPANIVDPERISVCLCPLVEGLYKIHITCNTVNLSGSPFLLVARSPYQEPQNETKLPIFQSDATKIKYHGQGLEKIALNSKNEFVVDGSNAGNNILLVGICGPKGQCDEVSIKHMGQNIYNVTYRVEDHGQYVIAAKWGEDHIPGSPFKLETL